MCTQLGLGTRKGKEHSECLEIDGRIILKLILGKKGFRCGLESSGS
jgi:hypothetical protein